MSDEEKTQTHFGFQKIDLAQKQARVAEVFDSVANHYDLMNDFMSLGLHRLWKKFAVAKAHIKPGQVILDIAAGTGDLTQSYAKKLEDKGTIVMTDINAAMLQQGQNRLLDAGIWQNIHFALANAENLPFTDDCFDLVSIAFGLRNVTDKNKALASMYRVLKPGGKCLILEFSHPISKTFNKIYDFYSFKIIPRLGEWVLKDRQSYQYLVESIRMHPDQETLKNMLLKNQFEDVAYFNLSGGIVALHIGYKY